MMRRSRCALSRMSQRNAASRSSGCIDDREVSENAAAPERVADRPLLPEIHFSAEDRLQLVLHPAKIEQRVAGFRSKRHHYVDVAVRVQFAACSRAKQR